MKSLGAGVSKAFRFAEAAWIDHSLGVVLAQWVSFEEHRKMRRACIHGETSSIPTWRMQDEPWSKSSPASRKPGAKIFAPHGMIFRKQATI